jgi:hypothetical protein
MKGDFSRDSYDATKHYSRVLKQQGRVDLDADWNEQASIWEHRMRALVVDLFGQAAGPKGNCGFGVVDWGKLSDAEKKAYQDAGVQPAFGDFILSAGRYYVDGMLVEIGDPITYGKQSYWSGDRLKTGARYLAYLDVWERHVTYIEDDAIREKALGGPDTATRAQVCWQVKLMDTQPAGGGGTKAEIEAKIADLQKQRDTLNKQLAAAKKKNDAELVKKLSDQIDQVNRQIEELQKMLDGAPAPAPAGATCDDLLGPWRDAARARMCTRLEPAPEDDDPCVLPPDSLYRGLENCLYRVEIHRGSDNPDGLPATFKWSRENGSVVTRWLGSEGYQVRVDSTRGFEPGNWVELTDDTDEWMGRTGTLVKVTNVDGNGLTVDTVVAWNANLVNAKVRRWDQQANDELALDDGAIDVATAKGEFPWIELEKGIQVQFEAGEYRSGDYWLITARVAGGTIDWPKDMQGNWLCLKPRGVKHHYAALAMIEATNDDPFVNIVQDCRCQFAALACIAP